MPDEMNICLSVLIECSDICGIASISRTFGSRTMNWPSIFTLSSVILSASLVSGNEPAATGSDMAKWFTGLPKTLRCRVYTVVISMAPRSEPRGWLRLDDGVLLPQLYRTRLACGAVHPKVVLLNHPKQPNQGPTTAPTKPQTQTHATPLQPLLISFTPHPPPFLIWEF